MLLGIQFIVIASLLIALSNYYMRRSIDAGGSTKGFLVVQLFIVFLVAIVLHPVRNNNYAWSGCMAGFSIVAGLILALMVASLGRALERGPSGLTFASVNAASVLPIILLVLFFGSPFDYKYTLWNGLGSILVVLGLFWAGWSGSKKSQKSGWSMFTIAASLLNVLFLVFLSWRALFINYSGQPGLFLSFDLDDATNQWFMPTLFFTAFLFQLTVYLIAEKRALKPGEFLYGILGGIANGIGTFFMIRATEVATPVEHAIIYPLLAVMVIIVCNLWGRFLYKEHVNWKANAVCILGVLLGSIDWSALL